MRVVTLPSFDSALAHALGHGVIGVAIVDRGGHTLACEGDFEATAMHVAAFVMHQHDAVKARLFAGEVLTAEIDGGHAAVGVAKRQLFVVAKLSDLAAVGRVEALRARIAAMLADADDPIVPPGNGGSGSGPAELQLVELGLTVPRAKA